MYACVIVCTCVCVRQRERECGKDIISDKTKYMHSEDSNKLVNLSSLISLHLRYLQACLSLRCACTWFCRK